MMGKLRQYVDAGSPNRKWNDTLALVETNKAALMIVGDWAKGDFAAANLKVDKDWGCALAPGSADAYIMTINAFAFPKSDKPEQVRHSANWQSCSWIRPCRRRYTLHKGRSRRGWTRTSSRSIDARKQGQQVMAQGPAHQLPHFLLSFTPDTLGQINDVLAQYWANPDMSPAEATRNSPASSVPPVTDDSSQERSVITWRPPAS